MSDKQQIIDIQDIDLNEKRYRVSLTNKDIRALAGSIKANGLLSPPLLIEKGDRYVIVSGFSRIKALLFNGATNVHAIIAAGQTSELACCLKAIAAEAFQRALGPAEIILCIKQLLLHTNPGHIAEVSEQAFNSVLSESFIRKMEKISTLPEPALELIHAGSISIKSAVRLTELPGSAQTLFLSLFGKIKASSSKQLEIITNMFEITARDKIGFEDLVSEPYLKTLISDDEVPPGVKADRLRSYLQEKRFPFLSETRNRVQGMIEKLKLGPGIKFLAPENFESLDYHLSFSARSSQEFKTRLEKIEQAADQAEFKQIFTP